ncbi:transglycosylase SLT domain-containing protein [Falsiroseomonas sp. HW251]|uniref:transglycosylase SLT domain-containing protein n=1 Tax=Falsiroseomonas sp. HW251 TaxID=3390998 RepID=UPI003D31DA7E
MPARRAGRTPVAAVALALNLLVAPFASSPAEATGRARADAAAKQVRADDRRTARPTARLAARAPTRATAAARPTPPSVRTAQAAPILPNVEPGVLEAVWAAAGARDADGVLLLALAWRESRFDPDAENPASSARGLMQFTRDTWLETIRDHGRAHGLDAHAAAVVTDRSTGDVSVADAALLAEILALRDDPGLSAALAMTRIRKAQTRLAEVLKRPVRAADVYLVHFLGQVGAERFLRQLARTPSHRAASYVSPEIVAANGSVFIARSGRHRSLNEVYADIQGSLDPRRGPHAAMLARMRQVETIVLASAP